MKGDVPMRPLMEILEDERSLMLKAETIQQNMLRYHGPDVDDILKARMKFVERDIEMIRNELREYIAVLFK